MEKRVIPRSSFNHPVSFDLAGERPNNYRNVSCDGSGVDISSGGIGLMTDQPIEIGKIVRLMLPVVYGQTTIPVFSISRWTQAAGSRYRVGLQFLT
jgi:hypothetical protein